MQPHTFWTSWYANKCKVPCGVSHAEIGHGGAASQHTASVHYPRLWKADSAVLAGGSLAHATVVTSHMIIFVWKHVLTCLMLRSVLADSGCLPRIAHACHAQQLCVEFFSLQREILLVVLLG